jgi:hypothetical protein
MFIGQSISLKAPQRHLTGGLTSREPSPWPSTMIVCPQFLQTIDFFITVLSTFFVETLY